jgi:histone acetyltransferase (RNA polymerase elongator complex component)
MRRVIPIFIPNLGCRVRCIYCDQGKIVGKRPQLPSPERIREEIELWLKERLREKEEVQVAFFGGSFTGLGIEWQERLLSSVRPFVEKGLVHSLRLSTRPDLIDERILELLKREKVKTIELGVQSMDPEVLRLSKRPYGVETVQKASKLIKHWGFELGIQIMVGLPGETLDSFKETVKKVIQLGPSLVRIYPTLVLKGTELERWYHQGLYKPLELWEAVERSKEALCEFEKAHIQVVRIGLQREEELERNLVAGPYHPAFGELVRAALFLDKLKLHLQHNPKRALVRINPKDESLLYGHKGELLKRLKASLEGTELIFQKDETVKRGDLKVESVS